MYSDFTEAQLKIISKVENMLGNIRVHDLTNIMRGEKEDRARLYGMRETLRVARNKLERLKNSLIKPV